MLTDKLLRNAMKMKLNEKETNALRSSIVVDDYKHVVKKYAD